MVLGVDTIYILSLLSGLVLVVYGMRSLANGFQILFAGLIRRLINSLSTNPVMDLIVGISNSFLIQSELSSSIMAISYSGSGLLSLNQLILLLIGGGLGSVITVWLFVLPFEYLDLLLIGVAVLPMLYTRSARVSSIAKVLFSFGLMFLGFNLMVSRPSDSFFVMFEGAFQWMTNLPPSVQCWLLVLPAIVLAMSVRSIVALMAAMIALVYSGVVSAALATLFVLAINLARSVPVLVAAFESNRVSKRGALSHLIVQSIVLLLLSSNLDLLFSFLHTVVDWEMPASAMMTVPLVHTIFQILSLVVCSILFVPIKKMVVYLVPDGGKKVPQQLKFIGRNSHMSPILAVEQVYQEVKKLAAMVETTVEMTVGYLQNQEPEIYDRVIKYESITDNISHEINDFLGKVILSNLSERQGEQVRALLRMSDELESVADRCKAIVMDLKQIRGLGMILEGPWYDELKKMMELLLEVYDSAFWQVTDQNEETPQDYRAKVSKFDKRYQDLRKSYSQWLRSEAGSQYEWEVGVKYGDIIQALMQARKQTMNIFEAYVTHYK